MTDLAYRRVSRDTQSTERQAFLLKGEGFGEPDGVTVFEDPATSSKIPALERDGFKALAAVAVAGDTIKVAELFRLCRDLEDVIAVTKWCRARKISLRVLSGALSNIVDLAADDATTVMYVGILASVGQFQRDLQNELTRDGLRAANAAGRFGGRRPAITDPEAVRAAYASGDGESIKALAKRFGVSRGAIRTALGTDPRQNAAQAAREALPVPTVTISMPGAMADFLRVDETSPMEEGTATREALVQAVTVRRGAGYSLSVTAPLAVHRELLEWAWTLAGGEGLDSSPSEIRAYRTYRDRIAQAATSATQEASSVPQEAKEEAAPATPALTSQEVARAARRAKAGHTIYTAPDGTTRESKRAYTAALAIFNPAEAITAPGVVSFHGNPAAAETAGRTWERQGYRVMVVPVTTDGTTDPGLAARIAAMRTTADEANIPAQEVAKAEAKRDRAAADVARYRERTPDPKFGETPEVLAGWLAKAEADRDEAQATADRWRAEASADLTDTQRRFMEHMALHGHVDDASGFTITTARALAGKGRIVLKTWLSNNTLMGGRRNDGLGWTAEPPAPSPTANPWGRGASRDAQPTVANVRALLAKAGMRQARRRSLDSSGVSGVVVSSGGTGSAAVLWEGPEGERERNLEYASDAMTRVGWNVTRDGDRLTVKP